MPLDGHIPPPPGHLSEPELAVVGPLARYPFDLELMLDLITDAPELKRTAYRLALPPARHTELREFRVVVWNDAKAYALDGAYAAAIDGLVEDVARLGVKVDTTARPAIDPTESFRVYMQTLFGIIGVGVPPPARDEIIAGGKAAPEGSYPRMVAEAMGQSLAQFAMPLKRAKDCSAPGASFSRTMTCCCAQSRRRSRFRMMSRGWTWLRSSSVGSS